MVDYLSRRVAFNRYTRAWRLLNAIAMLVGGSLWKIMSKTDIASLFFVKEKQIPQKQWYGDEVRLEMRVFC